MSSGHPPHDAMKDFSPLMRVVIWCAVVSPAVLFLFFELLSQNFFNRLALPDRIEAEAFVWPQGCHQREFIDNKPVDDSCLTWSNKFNIDNKYYVNAYRCKYLYRLGNNLVGTAGSLPGLPTIVCYIKKDEFYQPG